MLPVSVARSSSGTFTIGRIAYRREGVFFPTENSLSVGKGGWECTAWAKYATIACLISVIYLLISGNQILISGINRWHQEFNSWYQECGIKVNSACHYAADVRFPDWFAGAAECTSERTSRAVVSDTDPLVAPTSQFPRLQSVGTSEQRLAGRRPLHPAARWRLDVGTADRWTPQSRRRRRLKSRGRARQLEARRGKSTVPHGTADRGHRPLVIGTISARLITTV